MTINATYLDISNCVCLTLPGKNVPKVLIFHLTEYNVLSKHLPQEPLKWLERQKKDLWRPLLSWVMALTWVTELAWMSYNSCKLLQSITIWLPMNYPSKVWFKNNWCTKLSKKTTSLNGLEKSSLMNFTLKELTSAHLLPS